MASYAEYAAKFQNSQDPVATEIADASGSSVQRRETASQDGGFVVPDKFKDRQKEDILRDYVELEKVLGRQGVELNQMRRVVGQLVELQTQQAASTSEPVKPVTVDDLYADPDAAVRKIVRDEASRKIQALENELLSERRHRQMSDLRTRYPSWEEQVRTDAFKQWVSESPYRARLAEEADAFNFDSADTLLGLYYDTHGKTQMAVQEALRTERTLRDATLESPSGGGISGPDNRPLSRAALQELRINAKRGDEQAERWLKANAENIVVAYETGALAT